MKTSTSRYASGPPGQHHDRHAASARSASSFARARHTSRPVASRSSSAIWRSTIASPSTIMRCRQPGDLCGAAGPGSRQSVRGCASTLPKRRVLAAIEGAGLARVMSYKMDTAKRAGKLAVVLKEFELEPLPVHILYAPRKRVPLKLRAFLNWMTPRLKTRLTFVFVSSFPACGALTRLRRQPPSPGGCGATSRPAGRSPRRAPAPSWPSRPGPAAGACPPRPRS